MAVKIDGNGFISSLGPLGQCRLIKSGTDLVLIPFNGNQLFINGGNKTIPTGGVSLAASGTTINTSYNVYAYMNGSSMALARDNLVGHIVDATYGLEVKSDDPTLSLVGKVRTDAAGGWIDIDSQRFVLSWYNRRLRRIKQTRATAVITALTASSIYSEIASNLRCEFLTWANSPVEAKLSCFGNLSPPVDTYFALNFDGASNPEDGAGIYQIAGSTAYNGSFIQNVNRDDLSEGYHYVTPMWRVGSNSTATIGVGANAADKPTVSGWLWA